MKRLHRMQFPQPAVDEAFQHPAGLGVRAALPFAVHDKHAAQSQFVAFAEERVDFPARTLHAHAMQIEARLGGVSTLLQLAIHPVLNTRAFEREHIPGVQGSCPLIGQWVGVPAALYQRRLAARIEGGGAARLACRTHTFLALQGRDIGHLAQKIVITRARHGVRLLVPRCWRVFIMRHWGFLSCEAEGFLSCEAEGSRSRSAQPVRLGVLP